MKLFAAHFLVICILLIGCGKADDFKITAKNDEEKADTKANARLLLKNVYDSAILRMPIALQAYWEHIHGDNPTPLPNYRKSSNGGQYLVLSKDDIGAGMTSIDGLVKDYNYDISTKTATITISRQYMSSTITRIGSVSYDRIDEFTAHLIYDSDHFVLEKVKLKTRLTKKDRDQPKEEVGEWVDEGITMDTVFIKSLLKDNVTF